MKKIITLLALQIVFANVFSQSTLFQENFEKGILNETWKIISGKWYVANLGEKGIKRPAGDNNFALASAGNAEIIIDIPVRDINPEIPMQLNFTYWVHSKGSKGFASIIFLNEREDSLTSKNFEALSQKGNWDVFNQQFKVPGETALIRLKLGEREPGWGANTVYFKNIWITRRR